MSAEERSIRAFMPDGATQVLVDMNWFQRDGVTCQRDRFIIPVSMLEEPLEGSDEDYKRWPVRMYSRGDMGVMSFLWKVALLVGACAGLVTGMALAVLL